MNQQLNRFSLTVEEVYKIAASLNLIVINLWRKTHMLACGMKATFFDLT